VYGAETSGCDSPYSLVNQTFQWINDNIKNDIDFVIWTGDSARHDNDDALPRTPKQVVQQNEYMVAKFAEVFGQDADKYGRPDEWSIPVVPTFGNNDIMPHNIFEQGPNRWTKKYLDVWRSFIPEAQRHQFQQGGWFSVEVIPGHLAVISLNTMYVFPALYASLEQLLTWTQILFLFEFRRRRLRKQTRTRLRAHGMAAHPAADPP
jgi:endopolyphosphatase